VKPAEALLSTLDPEHAKWRPLLSLIEAAIGEMERPVECSPFFCTGGELHGLGQRRILADAVAIHRQLDTE